jgi:hypothetical protein
MGHLFTLRTSRGVQAMAKVAHARRCSGCSQWRGSLNQYDDLVRAGQQAQSRGSVHQHRSRSEDATCGASSSAQHVNLPTTAGGHCLQWFRPPVRAVLPSMRRGRSPRRATKATGTYVNLPQRPSDESRRVTKHRSSSKVRIRTPQRTQGRR